MKTKKQQLEARIKELRQMLINVPAPYMKNERRELELLNEKLLVDDIAKAKV